MAIYHEDIVNINLESGNIHRSFAKHSIGSADNLANRFGVRVYRDGAEVDLSGCSCYGYFRNSNGDNIALTSAGTVDGNVAYVTLPQACYNYEGQFTLTIKLIGGGITGTMRIVDGMVDNTNTGSAVAPTETVPSYTEILETYDAMVAAVAVANGAIATTFNAATVYPAGSYVINDGSLYRITADHAANVTWANTSKVAVNFGDELSATKSALSDENSYVIPSVELRNAIGHEILSFTDPTEKKYIGTNKNIGTTINLTPIVATSAQYCYAIIACKSGDVFSITGEGGSAGRLWAFIDSNDSLLSVAPSGTTGNGLIVVAPTNAAKLIVNSLGNAMAYKGHSVANQLKEIAYGNIEFGFVQGSRSSSSPLVVDTDNAAVITKDPILCKKGDIISVAGTYTGIRYGIAGRATDETTYSSGWKTDDYSYTVAKDGIYYVKATKANGTDSIVPSDITFTVTKINYTFNGNAALIKANALETELTGVENYVGETDVFNFKEDSGYALNYTTPLKYSNFKVKIDKVSGNHTTYSIRVRYNNGTAMVLKSGCVFGKEYDIETDLTQYNTLMIYQSAPSSHPTAYGSTSYNLFVTGNNTLNGRVLTLETDRSVLQGKKIVMLGDSITQLPVTGTATGKGIVEYVAEMTGATVIRGAIGGSKMQAGDPLPSLPITNLVDAKTALNVVYIADAMASGDWSVQTAAAQWAYDNGGDKAWKDIIGALSALDMSTVDAVTLFAGTNDFNAPLFLGNENSDTIYTYCGAINHIIQTLYTAYPKLTIFVFTPIVRHFVDSKTESTAADFSDNYVNAKGDKLTDYVAGAKATALKNHIPCLDMYNGMGWNLYNFWEYFPSNDGCHPRNSFDKLAMLISRFMLSNWNR